MCRRYKFWQIFLLQFKRTMLYYSPKDFILLSKIQIVVLQYVAYPYKIYAVIMPYFSAYLLMQNGVLRMFLPSSNNSVAGFLIQFEWKNRSRLGQCAGADWDTFDAAKLMIFSETVAF